MEAEMRRILFVLIIAFVVFELSAISEFAGVFTLINTSARGVAFGNGSGTADIWDISPLGIWSNPAKLGYHKGLTYGYSDTPWFEELFPDIYIKSYYLSIGWKGIGVMLPAPSDHKKWGTMMNYGEQTITDTLENEIGTFESWDADTKYAIGINMIEFTSNFFQRDFLRKINNFGEISLGYSYDDLYSKLSPIGTGTYEVDEYGAAESSFSSYGIIGRISPLNETNALGGFCTLAIIGGINYINPSKDKIKYKNENRADYLPWGTHSAIAGKIAVTKQLIPDIQIPVFEDLFKNFFSFYYSYDDAQYGKDSADNPGYWGKGYEFTLLDIYSVRKGHYNDTAGQVKGDTSGWGINLNYKDILQFQYNYAEFPGGELQDKQDMEDYVFKVDFFKLFGKK